MASHPRCPLCRAGLDPEAIVADEAQDTLLSLLWRQPQDVRLALAPYLGLFRGDSRDLAPERALRLAREVLALEADPAILAAALSRTVEAVRAKWERTGARRRLTDHGYLLPVLEGVRAERPAAPRADLVPAGQATPGPRPAAARRAPSATLEALAALQSLRGDTDAD